MTTLVTLVQALFAVPQALAVGWQFVFWLVVGIGLLLETWLLLWALLAGILILVHAVRRAGAWLEETLT